MKDVKIIDGKLIFPEGIREIVVSEQYYAFPFPECCRIEKIAIPSSVTKIGDSAFRHYAALTSVTIPSSVTSIGDNVFSGCKSLATVTIPASVTSIGATAFNYTPKLETITVAPDNQAYSSRGGFLCSKDGETLLAVPGALTSVTIPEGVVSIGNYAFCGCSSLVSVTIPSSVTSIGMNAFVDCTSITSVTIPSSVDWIGCWAFACCDKLTSILLEPGNTAYCVKNHLVLTKDGHSLVFCPCNLSPVEIPRSVTRICDGAFCGFCGQKTLTIPHNVKDISDEAFMQYREDLVLWLPKGFDLVAEFCSFQFPKMRHYRLEHKGNRRKGGKA